MLVQMVLFPPLTHDLQILWQHFPIKNRIYNHEKWHDTLSNKSDTYNS
jgi:hypothetical protein